MSQLGFYIDTAVCTGCKACELACKDKNSFDVGPRARRVREVCGGAWTREETTGAYTPEKVYSYSVSYSCGHCESPSCVAVCPTGAHQKNPDNGIVWVDHERCIGCGSCAINCPYGAPQLIKSEGIVRKCNLCEDLMKCSEDPACVAICPQRALKVAPLDELHDRFGELRDIQPLPSSALTHPSVVIGPHRNTRFDASDVPRTLSLGQ